MRCPATQGNAVMLSIKPLEFKDRNLCKRSMQVHLISRLAASCLFLSCIRYHGVDGQHRLWDGEVHKYNAKCVILYICVVYIKWEDGSETSCHFEFSAHAHSPRSSGLLPVFFIPCFYPVSWWLLRDDFLSVSLASLVVLFFSQFPPHLLLSQSPLPLPSPAPLDYTYSPWFIIFQTEHSCL